MTSGSRTTSPGSALRDLLAVIEHHHAVGERHHRRHHVLDHDHRDLPLVPDAPDERGEPHRLGGVHAGDDLVEHEHARRRGEGARELEPLAGRERERPGELTRALGEPHELDNLGGALPRRARHTPAAVDGADRDVLGDREVRERPHDLVRADDRPRAPRWWAAWPLTRHSSSRTSPEVGRSEPAMRLKSVVLPAPFGPMTPRISPSRSSSVTPSTALRPPKVFEIACVVEERGHCRRIRRATRGAPLAGAAARSAPGGARGR